MDNGQKEKLMMAQQLLPLDTDPLEVVVNKPTGKTESSLPPLANTQREFASVTMKHLTLPSRTVLIRKENPPNAQITEALSIYTLSVDDVSGSPRTTDSLPATHTHWMSALQQRIYMSLIF